MTSHILTHRHFNGYSREVKEELQSYSLFRLFKCGIYSYDLSRQKDCFNYFTCAIFNNYYTALGRRYRELNNKQKLTKELLQATAAMMPYNEDLQRYAEEFKASCER